MVGQLYLLLYLFYQADELFPDYKTRRSGLHALVNRRIDGEFSFY